MSASSGARRLTAKRFHEHPGVEDWRVLYLGAHAHYACDSFAHAVRLVRAIGEVVEAVGHVPDVDVRPEGVTVRTATGRDGSLGPLDVRLAQGVAEAARREGCRADPSRLMAVGIAVAQDRGADVRPFWAAVLGYEPIGPDDALDPQRRNPHVWLHELDPPKPGRGRVHIDVSVPADAVEQRVAAALAAGGRLVERSPRGWWTIASPENHGVDITAWPDVEDEPASGDDAQGPTGTSV